MRTCIIILCISFICINSGYCFDPYKISSDKISSDPADWYCEKPDPRVVQYPGEKNKSVQTVYFFKLTEKRSEYCISKLADCPYKYPSFDKTPNTVNKVLDYLGLPRINDLKDTSARSTTSYSPSNYSIGKITIFPQSNSIWKVGHTVPVQQKYSNPACQCVEASPWGGKK